MSNWNRWRPWYAIIRDEDEPTPYGDSPSYQLLADWVAECDVVEDWGCGKGYMRNFIDADRYVGIDGTHNKFVDVHAELSRYRSDAPGIVIRHILEHDARHWSDILTNAVASFRRRLGIALFTPMQDETTVLALNHALNVPDIGFAEHDIVRHLVGCDWTVETIDPSPTQYGIETLFFVERKPA